MVKHALRTRTQLSLDLRGIFIAAMDGGAERYAMLDTAIKELDAHIKQLQLEQEMDTILSAKERLEGFKMEFTAARQEVKADRDASRRAAKTFGKSMNAGEQGIMTMYAAEAWHELAAFGELAIQQRKRWSILSLGVCTAI